MACASDGILGRKWTFHRAGSDHPTVLTDGNSVSKIGTFGDEIGLTQIMIAVDPTKFSTVEQTDAIVDEILADVVSSEPIKGMEKFFIQES